MVARVQQQRKHQIAGDDREAGQSLVEFLLLLPVVIGMVVILLRMNSAITTSIVNQKHVRMMVFRLNGNSAVYPVLRTREEFIENFASPEKGRFYNRMQIGLAARPIDETDDKPEANVRLVARSPELSRGKGPDHAEPEERGYVRVRTTMDICTQTNFVEVSGNKRVLDEDVMTEGMVLDFCAPQPQPETG